MNNKKAYDKFLLNIEIFIGFITTIIFIVLTVLGALIIESILWLGIILLTLGFIQFILLIGLCLKFEQIAGFYKCEKCSYTSIPKYSELTLAPHICRSRYMKCKKCGEYAWHKKIIE